MFRGMVRPGPVRLARCALALACIASALPARADGEDREARARELFVQGRDQVQRGDIEAGCQKLRESHALSPDAVGPLLNVADCDERAGRLATALSRFRRAAALAPEGDHRRAFAERRAASVEPRVPRLVLELSAGAPLGTRAMHDGKAIDVATLPSTQLLDPGNHRFQVTAPGRTPRTMVVSLSAGAAQRLVLAPGEPEGAAAAPAADAGGPSARAIAGWSLSGVGAAAIVVGVVAGILVGVHAGTYEDHCEAGVCDSEGLDAAAAGDTLSVVSPVSLALGAVALGIGVPLWLTSPEVAGPARGASAAAAPGSFRVAVGGAF
jgi:hypothetical protein